MRIGVTGHSNLSPESEPLVIAAILEALAAADGPVVGVSCLARGADQLFARAVLDSGGELEVVLPARDYRDRKVQPGNRARFDELVAGASTVITLAQPESNRDAYLAASEHVLAGVDAMIAVWDGRPSDGHGGTGDVVKLARDRGLPVTVIWPDGAGRI